MTGFMHGDDVAFARIDQVVFLLPSGHDAINCLFKCGHTDLRLVATIGQQSSRLPTASHVIAEHELGRIGLYLEISVDISKNQLNNVSMCSVFPYAAYFAYSTREGWTLSDQSADVVVIGAGAVGALQAFRLAQRGHRVTVVERREPCRGTTSATFSWTSAHGKTPLFYHLFNFASIEIHQSLGEELGVDVWWRPCFSLRPVLDESAYDDAFTEAEQRWQEGYRVSWINGEEARRLVPMLSPETLGASLCEGEGTVNPFRLVFAALDAARKHGAHIRWKEEVIGFDKTANRLSAVCTDRDTIACDVVVNAAGPQAPDIARLAGVPIPFQHSKGEILLTEKFPARLNGVVGSVQQTFSGNFLIGATQEPDTFDRRTTMDNMRRIARHACRILPALKTANVIRSYAGIRPIPVDGVSVLGPTQRCEGFYWAVTHSGVTLGPVMAEVIAEFIEGRRHPAWDERLSPDRFQGET
jgi:glycine/D-amino acid oxidase-like deaminating enzyme